MTRKEAGILAGKSNITHGMTGTPEWQSWQAMMNRCYNKKQPAYASYGAVGKFACEFLRASPSNLLNLLGPRSVTMSLDRINNSGSYTCGVCAECLSNGNVLNVRWASRKTQNRNRSDTRFLTINGITKPLTQWAEESGLGKECVKHRVQAGKSGIDLISPSRMSNL